MQIRQAVSEVWIAPEAHERIHEYIARTLKKA
jgi:hypothetical protein